MNDDAFRRALAFTLAHEGGESLDPDDPGGRTLFGISSRAHPGVDLDRLSRSGAAAIYRSRYWDALDLDQLHPRLSLILFDTAVNVGPERATRFLQQTLNRLEPGERPLVEDGLLGPATRGRIEAFFSRGPLAEGLLRRELLLRRLEHYAVLGAEPGLRKYLRGWLRRTLDLNRQPEEKS